MRSTASQLTTEQIAQDLRPHVGDFVVDENAAMGNEDSAHKVRFGTVQDLGEVVVKPFSTQKYQRAKQEAAALRAVAEKGFAAIEPLDVVKGSLATYLLTRRVPGLRHLGQLDWNAESASPRMRTEITPTLNDVADSVAAYHQAGIVHGDYQPKNAFRHAQGGPIYGDAEKTWIDPPREVWTGFGNKDVALFGAVALYRGLLGDRSDTYRAGYLEDELLVPYLKAVDPSHFAMSPDERQQAILDYWLEGIRIGGVATWQGRKMQGHAA